MKKLGLIASISLLVLSETKLEADAGKCIFNDPNCQPNGGMASCAGICCISNECEDGVGKKTSHGLFCHCVGISDMSINKKGPSLERR